MTEPKNCAFQYATPRKVLTDRCGLTRSEAERLFNQHKAIFKDDMEREREPEMALWINMESEGDYRETAHHWVADDFELRDGKLYRVECME